MQPYIRVSGSIPSKEDGSVTGTIQVFVLGQGSRIERFNTRGRPVKDVLEETIAKVVQDLAVAARE